MSWVSDSEDESPIQVLPQRMAAHLEELSPSKRDRIASSIRDNYSTMYREINPQSQHTSPTPTSNSHTNTPHNPSHNPFNPLHSTNSLDHDIHSISTADQDNLRIYLDARNYEGRRGLRKRNFASTHPYLNDQAHYLGLADVNYLNEMYRESHNVEDIIKYLNQAYTRLKKRYPKDEKYRAKNFYTILGQKERERQSQEAKETQYEDESVPDVSSALQALESCDFSDSEEESRENRKERRHERTKTHTEKRTPRLERQLEKKTPLENEMMSEERERILRNQNRLERLRRMEKRQGWKLNDLKDDSNDLNVSNDSNDSNDLNDFRQVSNESNVSNELNDFRQADSESDSDSPVIVVGGRKLREKSALRGTLPESFKHLDAYKQKKRPSRPKRKLELRKGLAIRKKAKSRAPHDTIDFITEDDLDDVEAPGNSMDLDTELKELMDANAHFQKYEGEYVDKVDVVELDSSDEDMHNEAAAQVIDTDSGLSDGYLSSGSSSEDSAVEEVLFDDQPRWDRGDILEYDRIDNMPSLSFGRSHKRRSPGQSYKSHRSHRSHISSSSRSHSHTSHTSLRSHTSHTSHSLKSHSSHSLKSHSHSLRPNSSRSTKSHSPRQSSFSRTGSLVIERDSGTLRKPSHAASPRKTPRKKTVPSRFRSYTIPLEAESTTKFVKPRVVRKNPILPKDTHFPHGFILHSIDIDKVRCLLDGKTYEVDQDVSSCSFLGNSYTFTLVDVGAAGTHMDQLLGQLIKYLRALSENGSEEVYGAVFALIKWVLIIQKPFPEKTWTLLEKVLKVLLRNEARGFFLYPYFCMLWFSMKVVEGKKDDTPFYSYWGLFFKYGPKEGQKEAESLQIMLRILGGSVWGSVARYLEGSEEDAETILEGLLGLASICPGPGWSAFEAWYNLIDKEDADLHNQFLDALHVVRWPISESLLLKLYGTLAARRFANFEDEYGIPELLGRVRNRYDIPSDSFFDRFMQLVYGYISDMSTAVHKKRLITKLITSSHYQYHKDKVHFVMFVNRVNFLMLLVQVSDVDLKKSFSMLINSVLDCQDSAILELSIKAIRLYTEIAIERGHSIPVQVLTDAIKAIVDNHSILPTAKLLRSVINILKSVSPEHVLDIYTKTSYGGNELNKMAVVALTRLEKTGHEAILSRVAEYALNSLNTNMGRFPLPRVSEEEAVTTIVETLLKVWVSAISLLPAPNWTKMTLQTFPYVGNSNSRRKFELLYYIEVLKHTKLQLCQESVVCAILRSLAAYTPSKYLPQLMNMMSRNDVISFQPKYISEEVTQFHLQNSRSRVVLNILTNIEHTSNVPTATKKMYLTEFLSAISSEFDSYFASRVYKDFCVRTVKAVQVHCYNYVDKNGIIKTCVSKLGLSDWDEQEWMLKAPLNKLIVVHRELAHAIQFDRDACAVLARYARGKHSHLLYNLVSIYLRSANVRMVSKWRFVYVVLDFFNGQLRNFKLHITTPDFIRFLYMIAGVRSLEPITKTDQLFYYKSCYTICDILRYTWVLFDGFTDVEKVPEIIAKYTGREDVEYYSDMLLTQIEGNIQNINQEEPSHEEIATAKRKLEWIENLLTDSTAYPYIQEY